ncbi:MAG: hypothetical protein L3J03_06565 [Desulfobacterales bacterium]|nr:hypothetical protein [Desulfobacterales bacterium]
MILATEAVDEVALLPGCDMVEIEKQKRQQEKKPGRVKEEAETGVEEEQGETEPLKGTLLTNPAKPVMFLSHSYNGR